LIWPVDRSSPRAEGGWGGRLIFDNIFHFKEDGFSVAVLQEKSVTVLNPAILCLKFRQWAFSTPLSAVSVRPAIQFARWKQTAGEDGTLIPPMKAMAIPKVVALRLPACFAAIH
jgi:hypothetical protein